MIDMKEREDKYCEKSMRPLRQFCVMPRHYTGRQFGKLRVCLSAACLMVLYTSACFAVELSDEELYRLPSRAIEHFEQGRYKEAAELQEQFVTKALPRFQPRNKQEREFVYNCLIALAVMRDKLPDAAQTAEAWEMVYSFLSTTGSPQPQTYDALEKLATAQEKAGNLPRLELLRKEILRAYEEKWGRDHPALVLPLFQLALLYCSSHHLQKAEPVAARALAICRGFPKNKRTPNVGWDANNALAHQTMCLVRIMQGDHAAAYPHAKTAWEYFSKNSAVESDLETAVSLRIVAFLARANHDLERAESLYREALRRSQAAAGPDHLMTGVAHHGLALLLEERGKDAEAIAEYRAAIPRVYSSREVGHIGYRFLPCSQLACALLRTATGQEERKEALHWALEGLAAFREAFAVQLDFGSEQLRLEFQSRTSQHMRSLAGGLAGSGATEELAALSLIYKGAISDSISQDRILAAKRDEPRARFIITELEKTKAQLYGLPPSEHESQRATSLQGRRDELEQQLTVLGLLDGQSRTALRLRPADIAASLPPGTPLVDFLLYNRPLSNRVHQEWYGATIYEHGAKPRWVELAPARELRELLDDFDEIMKAATVVGGAISTEEETRLHSTLQTLRKLMWNSLGLATKVQPTPVVVCADGDVYRLPFAVLPGEDGAGFLADAVHFSYVDSARHLVPSGTPYVKGGPAVIFALPDFGPKPAEGALRFTPIPPESIDLGAYSEALGAVAYVEKDATEQKLRAQNHPGVLHLCTHGFYLPRPNPITTAGAAEAMLPLPNLVGDHAWHNELRRSGVALAGAQSTANNWSAGMRSRTAALPDPLFDGILTAEEAGALDLAGTELVTLASCVSGGGFTQSGEGILGLRRGFLIAGARNIITADWDIPGASTADFFLRFYRSQPFQSVGPRLELRFAAFQAAELRRLARDETPGYAIYRAGAFRLTFRR